MLDNDTEVSKKCPLCGGDNECAAVRGESHCWCVDVSMPPEVLKRVPPELRDVACICPGCVAGRSSE